MSPQQVRVRETVQKDGYIARRRILGIGVDDIMDINTSGGREESVPEAWKRFAVKTPILFLGYNLSETTQTCNSRPGLPASSSCFSSSVSFGWKTPFLQATVVQVYARLKTPKLSVNMYQAKLVSLSPDFWVVGEGEGGIVEGFHASYYCAEGNQIL